MTFKIGDIVSLKSGGARMTVEGLEDEFVDTVWNDGKNTMRDRFRAGTLTKTSKSAPSKIAASAERKRHLLITDGMRITLTKKGKENPGRRPETRAGAAFGLYKNGMSVAEFLSKKTKYGNTRRVDVLADVERGNITVSE